MLLDLNVNATSRLGLEPIKDKTGKFLYKACTPATILSVSIDKQKHEKGEFVGLEVPVLALEFTNFKLNADDPDRFLTHYIKPVGSKEKDGDGYKDREVTAIISDNTDLWKSVKHFLENLTQGAGYKKLDTIPKADVNKYFVLPELGKPEDRLAAYGAFFQYIVDFVNGNETTKSMIVDKDGKPLNLWLRLIPNYNSDPKRKAKYYEISKFVGQGAFEPLFNEKGIPKDPKIIKADNVDMTLNTASTSNTTPGSASNSGSNAALDNMAPEVKAALGIK